MNRWSWVLAVAVGAGGAAGSLAADRFAAQNGQAPAPPYDTWGAAASNIQDAVNAAATDDTVWVGAGRYALPPNATNLMGSNVVFLNRPLTLRSSNGAPESVVIDGEGQHRGVMIYSAATSTKRFALEGLTLSNGCATNYGGGLLVGLPVSADWNVYAATVQNCVLCDNTAAAGGGGFYAMYAKSLTASNCVFLRNRAGASGGGGLHSNAGGTLGEVRLADCLVAGNTAAAGGGFYGNMTTLSLERCRILDNRATNTYGGGVYLSNPQKPSLQRNSLIANNAAAGGGGFAWERKQALALDNCTVVSNSGAAAGGIRLRYTSDGAGLRLCNTIVFSNATADLDLDSVTNAFFTNSCLGATNGLLGAGNTTNPPVFVNFAGQDYRLTDASPCLNTGLPLPWMADAVDLAWRPRIDRVYGLPDMGCYERLPQASLFRLR